MHAQKWPLRSARRILDCHVCALLELGAVPPRCCFLLFLRGPGECPDQPRPACSTPSQRAAPESGARRPCFWGKYYAVLTPVRPEEGSYGQSTGRTYQWVSAVWWKAARQSAPALSSANSCIPRVRGFSGVPGMGRYRTRWDERLQSLQRPPWKEQAQAGLSYGANSCCFFSPAPRGPLRMWYLAPAPGCRRLHPPRAQCCWLFFFASSTRVSESHSQSQSNRITESQKQSHSDRVTESESHSQIHTVTESQSHTVRVTDSDSQCGTE